MSPLHYQLMLCRAIERFTGRTPPYITRFGSPAYIVTVASDFPWSVIPDGVDGRSVSCRESYPAPGAQRMPYLRVKEHTYALAPTVVLLPPPLPGLASTTRVGSDDRPGCQKLDYSTTERALHFASYSVAIMSTM